MLDDRGGNARARSLGPADKLVWAARLPPGVLDGHAYAAGVRYVVLGFIAVFLSLAQYSWLARWQLTPDLPLALAAWAMVDGTKVGVLWRAWLIGSIADVFDPGCSCFHAFAFLALALCYLPMRDLVFRTRLTGWASWAAICSVTVTLVDSSLTDFGDSTWITVLASAAWTAVAAMSIGWLFSGLPDSLQPVGKGGA
jgi:hypothetical protein